MEDQQWRGFFEFTEEPAPTGEEHWRIIVGFGAFLTILAGVGLIVLGILG